MSIEWYSKNQNFIYLLFMFLFFWTFLKSGVNGQTSSQATKKTINVGLLFVKDVKNLLVSVGYRTSASAVLIGLEQVRNDHLLDGYDFNFTTAFDECSESQAAGKAAEMIEINKVDVIFGPTCSGPGIAVAALAAYYDIPVFEWGLTTTNELQNSERFPTTLTLSVNSYILAMGIIETMRQFKWDQFVFVFSNDVDSEKCNSLKNDVQTVTSTSEGVTLAYLYQVGKITMDSLRAAVRAIKLKGRIIVTCFSSGSGFKRSFMQAAFLEDAITDEYIYFIAETNSRGFIADIDGGEWHYVWDSGVGISNGVTDEQSRKAFWNVFYLVDNMGMAEKVTQKYLNFSNQVIERMKEPPFNCVEECTGKDYSQVAKYAGQLADAFYAYALSLNHTLAEYPGAGVRNGTMIMEHAAVTFEGVGSGNVMIGARGVNSVFQVYLIGLNSSLLPQTYATLVVNNKSVTFNKDYTDESVVWDGGSRPLAVPICGFTENECPVNFLHDYLAYTVVVAFIILSAIVAAIAGFLYTLHMKHKEAEKQNLMWNVYFYELSVIQRKSKSEASQRSFVSGPSTSTKVTIESKSETSRFIFYNYQTDIIAAMKHEIHLQLGKEEKEHLRKLRSLENDNLNKFVGLCTDSPQFLSIWKYCSRGSLADVIENSSMQLDGFFMFSLIRDISNGIAYIHNSFLQKHGHLTSRCCLIDDRWQIKLSDYGLPFIRQYDRIPKKELLWTAPEILRSESSERTKECDVYSFGIICSEIITKTSAFNMENRKEKIDEIIYQIKKGGHNPMRPTLDIDETIGINPALLHTVRDCWTERPSERPNVAQIKILLRGMSDGRSANLMDHVFKMMESYASTLEEEVSERTKELGEEKKKSDVLLYRMLPKTVAEKLKLGQTVEPETFELVTIFFSDVVSFTKLAAKCSPLQVVTLLNDLYTVFDGIIEQHDVYKVETIGDGYLCVSGLPHRNGNEHCRHIARMALGFLSSLQFFRIPHLPGERINLRIGINCGSVVAGVVGLTMPRFCLFGDAVNTASRMESNGKPGKIHVSAEVNEMLTKVTGGFTTESRGEVIIKGKGVMETFWLLGETEENHNNNKPSVKNVQSIMKEREVVEKVSNSRSITPENDEKQGLYEQFKQKQTTM